MKRPPFETFYKPVVSAASEDGLIGFGSTGNVYLYEEIKTGRQVAVKKRKNFDNCTFQLSKTFVYKCYANAKVLMLIQAEHVIRIEDLFVSKVNDNAFELYIIMELCEGNIETYMEEHKKRHSFTPIPESEIVRISCQVVRGLLAFHAVNLAHRDLTPNSIMYRSGGSVFKIGEIGVLKNIVARPLTTSPPELMTVEEVYTPASDIFAYACIMYEMMTLTTRFFFKEVGANEKELHHQVCEELSRVCWFFSPKY